MCSLLIVQNESLPLVPRGLAHIRAASLLTYGLLALGLHIVIVCILVHCLFIAESDLVSGSLFANHTTAILLEADAHELLHLIIVIQILRLLIALIVFINLATLAALNCVLVIVRYLLECGDILIIALLHLVRTVLLVEVYLQLAR